MTLTIELGPDIVRTHPNTKNCVNTSNGSVMRVLKDRQTHRHTDGTDSITSTADAGGDKCYTDYKWLMLVVHFTYRRKYTLLDK